jgi:phenylalanyl-tRNA synthetase beta chain
MKFSKNWLKEFVDIDLSTEELCDQLTMAGLEVDSYKPFQSKFTGKDAVIDLDITPNRGDCFSILGVAREVAILNNLKLKLPKKLSIPSTVDSPTNISVCSGGPKYVGRYIQNVDLSLKTSDLIAERLQTSDHRLIDPVVDITNYILLELGQPLHAFDHDKLVGDIKVRFAKESEELTLLDESTIALNKDCLVIADRKGSIALAGIMGGLDSSVTGITKSIYLESAYFKPEVVRGRARRFGLQTDASMRFERGVDFNIQELAIARASELLNDSVGGHFGPLQVVTEKKSLPKQNKVSVNIATTNKILGASLSKAKVKSYLTGLGLSPQVNKETINTLIPSWRYDLSIEADLIEELARLEGYNALPTESLKPLSKKKETSNSHKVSSFLVSQGYSEIITYSFIDEQDANLAGVQKNHLTVSNPISQNMNVMRPSLWPGLLNTYIGNLNSGEENQKLFEIGSVFKKDKKGEIKEILQVGGLISGKDMSLHWKVKPSPLNFYNLKGDLESLLINFKKGVIFESGASSLLHPGKSAKIKLGNKVIGEMGAVHPGVMNQKDLKGEVLVFSLDLEKLIPNKNIKYKNFSRYPVSQRDLAFIVDVSKSNSELIKLIKSKAGKELVGIKAFDVYQGDNVPKGKKSVAFNLKWQSLSKTLVDENVDRLVEEIVNFLSKKIKAELRS